MDKRRQHCIKLTDDVFNKLQRLASEQGLSLYRVIEILVDKVESIGVDIKWRGK